ncbi:MAG: hypothetical protein IIC94_03920 [Chloroflexi bacterium]|nr:hypothetical protein [Chloroflexota bacterium]
MLSAVRASTAWATKGRAAALAAAVLLSLAAAACSDAPPPEPIDLVPADSNLVAHVDLGRILLDPDVAGAFESAPFGEDGPATLDEALAEVEAETGIDLLQFANIVVFGALDPAGLGDQPDFGILARGTFNGDAILDRIRLSSGGELREDEYRGHALLIGTEEDGSETVITVLADEVFVFGTLGAVTSVIDVLEDGEGALTGPLLDTYAALGDPLVKAAFAVPPGSLEYIVAAPTDAIPIPFDPSLISDITIVGFAADKEADLVTVHLTLEYASAASAEAASDYFSALLTLAGPFLPPGAAADLLNQIAVEYSGSTVEVSISATVDQLSAAADEVGSSMVHE